MPSSATILRAARPLFQQSSGAARATFRSSQFQNAFQRSSRRCQSTAAGTGATGAGVVPEAKVSWFNGPIGPKTVHFWAPVMKWAIVLAGISDFYRPAENLSLTQNMALTATGIIWTRWCLIIKPKNYLLAAVNFFLGVVGIIQCTRIYMYNQSVKGQTPKDQVEAAKQSAIASVKGVKDDVEAAIKK